MATQVEETALDAAELAPPAAPAASALPLPETARPIRIYWEYTIVLGSLHVLSLLVLVPWLFSWSGVALAVAGHLTFGMLGICVGYHRLLTHRGFTCPLWLEHTLAIFGICTLQDSPARWVAVHRMHHQHSDHQPDPHTPKAGLGWSHWGWLCIRNRDHDRLSHFERYVRDLLRDPFYLRLERGRLWLVIFGIHAALFPIAGLLTGWLSSGLWIEGARLAASWLVWGVFVRVVFVLHGTWAVNSLAHCWGYRNYETRDDSRNNWLVALLAHGEGWHNNHHAKPRAACHGHRWWEIDMAWWVIRALEKLGLARDVVRP